MLWLMVGMVQLQIINLPIVAAFAGLTVGCVPFLKDLLFGSEAPLGFLRDCLEVGRVLLICPLFLCSWIVQILEVQGLVWSAIIRLGIRGLHQRFCHVGAARPTTCTCDWA